VRNPSDVVKARQKTMVKVMNVDLDRKRISLSMKE
jgi:ribosomal protein S1